MLEAIRKVVRNGQITLPAQIRKTLNIKAGDLVRLEVKNNQLIMTPVSAVNTQQTPFFNSKWQKAIIDSEKAINEHRYSEYTSTEELRKDIEG